MRNSILIFIFALVAVNFTAMADSPITSTNFGKAYAQVPIVKLAAETGGLLTPELMEYLYDIANPMDVKMAVINQLGWDMDGKDNAGKFYEFLKEKDGYLGLDHFMENGLDYQMLCMAYLKAMDNYFETDEALLYAGKALYGLSESYTCNIVVAIIKAQKAMDANWCDVYRLTNNVRINNSLDMDMKPEAIEIIFEYMDMYNDDCD